MKNNLFIDNSGIRPIRDMRQARIERKFVCGFLRRDTIENDFILGGYQFYRRFPERWVNTIYFDDLNFGAFHANLAGLSERTKIRLRWYGGENIYSTETAQLEFKIRSGNIGFKEIKKIKLVRELCPVGDAFDFGIIKKSLFVDSAIESLFDTISPVVFVRYSRIYLESMLYPIRITIDKSFYYKSLRALNPFSLISHFDSNVIVELKSGIGDDQLSSGVVNGLDLRFTRNSKYVRALISLSSSCGSY
jgi:hypothetical protein